MLNEELFRAEEKCTNTNISGKKLVQLPRLSRIAFLLFSRSSGIAHFFYDVFRMLIRGPSYRRSKKSSSSAV